MGIVTTVLLIAFEAMAVATAMPAAVADLEGLPWFAWGFSAFLVPSLFAMVAAGEICDRAGPRRPFLFGVLTFAVGLALAGAAQSMAVFLLGRAIQGLGGGAVIVAIYVIVARSYAPIQRPRVFSAMSSAWVLPSIVGPAVAGWLTDYLTWRLVFLAVLPFVAVTLAFVGPRLGTVEQRAAAPAKPGRKRAALATAVGAAGVQYAGQELGWGGAAVGLAGIALLAPSLPRLLPPGTLRAARGLPTTIAMRGILAGAFFGAEAFLPLMLITERGVSTTLAGLALTGAALGWAAGSWYQGRPHLPLPRHRLVQLGAALVALGIAGASLPLLIGLPTVVVGAAWAFGGVGMGMATASLSVLMLALSPAVDQGANSAAIQVSDGLGSVVCIGVAGALFAGLHGSGGGSDPGAFVGIFAAMVGIAVLGAVLAPRVVAARAGAAAR